MPLLRPISMKETATVDPSQKTQNTMPNFRSGASPFKDSIKSQSQNSAGNEFLNGIKSAFASLWKLLVTIFTCSCFGKSTRPNIDRGQRPHFTDPNTDEGAFVRRAPARPAPARASQPQPSSGDAQCRQLEHMADTLPEIRFYDAQYNPVTAFMSNFWISPITVEGFVFQTGEAYFHAQKHWHDKRIVQEFANCRNGDEALAANKRHRMTPGQLAWWDGTDGLPAEKMEAMKKVLLAKFDQNPHLQKLLLSTKNTKLSEFNPGKGQDAFWSTGPKGGGRDELGKMMMWLRMHYRNRA